MSVLLKRLWFSQRAERAAQTVVGEPGDIAILQVHESRQGRAGQPRVRAGVRGVRVAQVAGRLGAHDDHVQRDQQAGAGQTREEAGGGIVHRGGRRLRGHPREVGTVARDCRRRVGRFDGGEVGGTVGRDCRRRIGRGRCRWTRAFFKQTFLKLFSGEDGTHTHTHACTTHVVNNIYIEIVSYSFFFFLHVVIFMTRAFNKSLGNIIIIIIIIIMYAIPRLAQSSLYSHVIVYYDLVVYKRA